jgi:RND family efflux transporter MFP subunit
MAKKKITIWIIIVVIVVGAIFYFSRPEEDQSKYVTAEATKTDIIQTVSITGGVTPVNKASLSFEGSGTVDKIYVEVGDIVQKGNKIMEIDDSVMSSQLSEAYLELNRQTEILQQSRRDWDNLSPDEKAAAKIMEEKARAAVWTLQKRMKKTTLYAPINGVVIKKYVDVGELASMASPVVMIMGESGLEIKAEIPESDIAKVAVGQKTKVTFDAFSSDEIFNVEVLEIEPAATIIQDVVYYEVTFNILTNDDRIRVGMSADIDIATAEKNNVLAVPGQAIKSDNGDKYVEVLIGEDPSGAETGDQKETKKIDIKVGLRGDDGMTEIASGKLKEGDEVITFTKEK